MGGGEAFVVHWPWNEPKPPRLKQPGGAIVLVYRLSRGRDRAVDPDLRRVRLPAWRRRSRRRNTEAVVVLARASTPRLQAEARCAACAVSFSCAPSGVPSVSRRARRVREHVEQWPCAPASLAAAWRASGPCGFRVGQSPSQAVPQRDSEPVDQQGGVAAQSLRPNAEALEAARLILACEGVARAVVPPDAPGCRADGGVSGRTRE